MPSVTKEDIPKTRTLKTSNFFSKVPPEKAKSSGENRDLNHDQVEK